MGKASSLSRAREELSNCSGDRTSPTSPNSLPEMLPKTRSKAQRRPSPFHPRSTDEANPNSQKRAANELDQNTCQTHNPTDETPWEPDLDDRPENYVPAEIHAKQCGKQDPRPQQRRGEQEQPPRSVRDIRDNQAARSMAHLDEERPHIEKGHTRNPTCKARTAVTSSTTHQILTGRVDDLSRRVESSCPPRCLTSSSIGHQSTSSEMTKSRMSLQPFLGVESHTDMQGAAL